MCRLWLLLPIVMLSACGKKSDSTKDTYTILARSGSIYVGDTIMLLLVNNSDLTNLHDVSFGVTHNNGPTEWLENMYFTPHKEGTYLITAFLGEKKVNVLEIFVKKNKTTEEIVALKGQLEEKEKALLHKENEVAARQQEVAVQAKKIGNLEGRLEEKEKALSHKENEVVARQQEVAVQAKKIGNLEGRLEEKEKEIAAIKGQLKKQRKALAYKEGGIVQQPVVLSYFRDGIKWRDNLLYESSDSDSDNTGQKKSFVQPKTQTKHNPVDSVSSIEVE